MRTIEYKYGKHIQEVKVMAEDNNNIEIKIDELENVSGGNMPMVKCQYCDATFPCTMSSLGLSMHMLAKHPDKAEVLNT